MEEPFLITGAAGDSQYAALSATVFRRRSTSNRSAMRPFKHRTNIKAGLCRRWRIMTKIVFKPKDKILCQSFL